MRRTPLSQLVGAAAGAWLGVVLAALATAIELVVSGTSPFNVAVPAMIGIHFLIGIGEALITVAALAFIRQTRPDLLGDSTKVASAGYGWIAAGLVIALALVFVSPIANPNPDGLMRVAQDQGFADKAQKPAYTMMPNYRVPFIQDKAFTTMAAGVVGVLIVAGLGFSMARLTRRKTANQPARTTPKTTGERFIPNE